MDFKKAMMRQSEKFIPGHTGWDWYNKTFKDVNIPDVQEWSDLIMKKWGDPEDQFHIRHSIYGTKIEREPYLAGTVEVGKPSDPVAVEMVNIQMSMKKPEDTIGDRDMTPEQYARFNDLIAKFPIKEQLWTVMNTDMYKGIQSNSLKRELLSDVVRSYRSAAKALLMSKDPSIVEHMIEDTTNDAMNILGRTAENDAVKALNHNLNLYKSRDSQKKILENDFLNLKENK